MLVSQLCLTFGDPVVCPWDYPGRNTGVGCHFLLQGIFPTQGSNLHLLGHLHCRQIFFFLPLSHWGNSAFLHTLLNSIQIKINLSDFQ